MVIAPMLPVTQLFGSGFGQVGSYSNAGIPSAGIPSAVPAAGGTD